MASAIKVGMAALIVFAVIAGSAGISAAGATFLCPLGCDIRIDDLSETVTVHVIINNASGPPTDTVMTSTTELIQFSMRLGGSASPGARYADFFEGLNGPVSDRLLAVIGQLGTDGLSQVDITFGSDVTFTLPPAAIQSDTLVENGTPQTPPLLKVSLGTQINSLTVASDVDVVPEPSTLVLIGGAVAGLVAVRSRRRR